MTLQQRLARAEALLLQAHAEIGCQWGPETEALLDRLQQYWWDVEDDDAQDSIA